MVKFFKKLITCICIILVISNFMMPNVNFADDSVDAIVEKIKKNHQELIADGSTGDKIAAVFSGIAGILAWGFTLPIIATTTIIQVVTDGIAKMTGKTAAAAGSTDFTFSADDVLFNKINLTSIDFFDINSPEVAGTVVAKIREQIALWYYVMRTIAITILLGILIFVGIRMAITTIASEKAIYKKSLFDWVTSLALVFLLHYIIRAVLWINTALVNILVGIAKDLDMSNMIAAVRVLAFYPDFTIGIGATIIYVLMTVQALMFLISYIKRMLVLAFLIIISPLITITYSIDKMGDQKAQALNTWLKEFIFNVLIQPFHCILYIVFVSIAVEAVSSAASFGGMILSLLCIKFVWDGEKIVRKIFGFEQASSLAAAAASGAVVGSMINKAASAGKTAAGGIKYAKNSKTGQLMKQKMGDKKAQIKDKFSKSNSAIAAGIAERKEERKVSKETERLKKKAAKNGRNISDEGIRKIAQKNVEKREKEKQQRKEEKQQRKQERFDSGRSIRGFANKVANSDLGKAIGSDAKRFARKLTRPENIAKVSAGIMAGAAMFALPDSNMFASAMGGIAAGKHAESKVREMRNRKSENYEEQLSTAWENHCNITGADKNDKNAFANWVSNMNNEGKLDMYSQKNVGKQEAAAAKDLKEKANLDDSQISSLIAEIKRAILSGQGYNPSEIGAKYGMSAGELNSLVGSFASMYNNQMIFGKTDAFDTQMEQYGYSHEDVVEEMSFSSSNTNTEELIERTLEDVQSDYGTDNIADIENTIRTELNRIESELEMAISDVTDLPTNVDIGNLVSNVQQAMDRGVADIEGIIKSELSRIGTTATPTTEVIREIKTHITEKHTLERDREIIRNS